MKTRELLNATIRTQLIDSSIHLLQTADPRIKTRVTAPLDRMGYKKEHMETALVQMHTDEELCYRYIDKIYLSFGENENQMKIMLSAFRLSRATINAIVACALKRKMDRMMREAGILPETPDTSQGPDL